MDTFLYLIYSLVYISLLIWSIKVTPKEKFWSLRSFILLVLIGLIFDNTVIAAGRFVGEGDFLETVNLLRYWSHALITPTLVLYSLGVLRSARTKGANNKLTFYGVVLFTIILILIEVLTEIMGLELQPMWEYGVLRYEAIEASNGPPLMVMIVTVILIIAGILIWKANGRPWMFIGALIMIMGSIIPIPINSSAITNGFELILLTLLVITKKQQEQLNN